VFIVEDDPRVASGLEEALRDGAIPIVRLCRSVAEATTALADPELTFEVALVDLALGDGSGLDVIRRIRATRPAAVPVVITVFDDPPTVLSAIRAGAHGYLLKEWAPGQLVSAIRSAAVGGAPMSPSIARLVLESLRERTREEDEPELTGREREVLALLCEGRTYREVGAALEIAVGTVQTHVKMIYGKLEVASKAELAAVAFRRGLVR